MADKNSIVQEETLIWDGEDGALDYLNLCIKEYEWANKEFPGSAFLVLPQLYEMKKAFDEGDRSKALHDRIMSVSL